ncbi:MAG: hypothetical protein ACP5U2_08025 [Bryobacteraceae bacterium]
MIEKVKYLVAAALAWPLGVAQADPVSLIVHAADPQVTVGGLGGGRFRATLDGTPVYVFCVDFAHSFSYNVTYQVDATPLYGDLAGETRYGALPVNGWNYGNNLYTATQRYMMAAWLTKQYAPYFADWSSSANHYQAQGIQSAIWALLDPAGSPSPPSGGNRNHWLQAAVAAIGQPSYDDPTDPLYRYFRVVTASSPTALSPQEFIVVVTPEPASILTLASALAALGVGLATRRRAAARSRIA